MDKKAFMETKYTNQVRKNVLKNVLIEPALDEKFSDNGIIFINSDGSEIKETYKELYNKSKKILANLQDLGLDKGDYVIFQIENDYEFVNNFWACILGGIIPVAVTVPTNTTSREDTFKKFFNISRQLNNPYVIIEDKIFEGSKEDYERVKIKYIKTSSVLSLEEKDGQERDVSEEDVAYIQYSSGSTEAPKGIILKNINLIHNFYQIGQKINVNDKDVSESWMPLTHDMGLVGFHLFMMSCKVNQVKMQPILFIKKPLLFLKKIQEHKVTLTCSPNFGLKWLIDKVKDKMLNEIDLSSVRLLFNGAEPISMNITRKFNEKFSKAGLKSTAMYQVYGMAEACLAVTFPKVNLEPRSVVIDRRVNYIGKNVKYVDIEDENSSEFAIVGKPLEGIKIKIVDDNGVLLNENCIGNIVLNGINIFESYFKSNDAKFTEDNFFYTGDLGFITNGELVIVGRKKDIIFINGKNYYANDLEQLLDEKTSVKQGKCAIVADFNEKQGYDDIVVFVKDRYSLEKFVNVYLEVKEALFRHLAINIKAVIPVNNIPKTTSGKLQRFRLRDEYKKGAYDEVINNLNELIKAKDRDKEEDIDLDSEYVEKFLGIVRNVLKREDVSLSNNIFDLGLDSIKVIYLINEFNKEFNVDIAYREVFKKSTLSEIAKYIKMSDSQENILIKKVEKKDYYNVSSSQKEMYILNRLESDSILYNTTSVLEFDGKFNIARLEDAIYRLVERHEVFRTYFEMNNNHVIQKVNDNIRVRIDIEDLTENNILTKNLLDQKIMKFIKPFDLGSEPILRVKIFKISSSNHIVVFDTHHIISDASSEQVIIRDLIDLYNGELLEKLDIQYKDYAEWQNEYLKSEKMKLQEKYWYDMYKDDIPVLDLNTDFLRPSVQSHKGDILTFNLDKNINDKIDKFKSQTGTTLYMILMASLSILLKKYSGQNDIVIGSPVARRPKYELRNLAGMFVNTLAIRNEVNDEISGLEFLQNVKASILKALENGDYPFEKLVELLNVERDISRNPIFDIFFALQNVEYRKVSSNNLKINKYKFNNKTAKFDISIYAYEENDGLKFEFEYCTDLFKKETIERMGKSFIGVINDLVMNSDKKVKDIDVLTDQDKKIVLEELNNTSIDYDKNKCVHQLFEESVLRNKDKIALIFNNESITYEELNNRSNKLALTLRKKGVKPNDIVGILIDRSFEMIIAILAVLKSGAGYLPIDVDYPEERIKYVIEDSKTRIILSCEAYKKKLDKNIKYIDLYSQNTESKSIENLKNVNNSSDMAYVIYTSGSTGKPKGVVLEHKSVNNFINVLPEAIEFNKNSRILNITTMSFDIFVLETLLPLVKGLTVVIGSEKDQKDPYSLRELIRNQNVDMIQMTPSMFSMQVNDEMYNYYKNVKTLILGGEALSLEFLKKIRKINNWRIYNVYGPTETTIWSSIKEVTEGEITIGKPIGNTKMYVLDKNKNICPIGIKGELCIGGDGLARGYLDRPHLTESKFIDNPYEENEKIYCTGDLVKVNENGEIVFVSRIDNQVKIRGHRIELSEIESILQSIDGVVEAVTVVKENKFNEKVICAYVVTSNDDVVKELKTKLMDKLPDYMLPSYFIKLNKMPLTPNGKINRKLLPDPVENMVRTTKYVKARNKVEEELIKIWCKVLGNKEVGIDDNFFEVGGTSLSIVRITQEIKNSLNLDIDPKILFQYSNIRKLCDYISGNTISKKEVQVKNNRINSNSGEMAIVGMAIKAPKANNIFEFWNNLKEGKECVTFFTDEELIRRGVNQKVLANKNYVKAASVLEDVEYFDAKFFGYNEYDAKIMDPQMRLFEECSWSALEDAGYVPEEYDGKIGLFAGASPNMKWQMKAMQSSSSSIAEIFNNIHLSNKEYMTTQTSYKLNLKGPSIYVNTACSSGLVILNLACQSIRNGECGMALVGVVSANDVFKNGYVYEEGMILSKDGHCRAFDANSSGTIFGEGVGVVVVKSLDEAVRDKDNIYAVIKGIGVNNDGKEKIGYSAPSIEGQKDVIRKALADSGIDRETIGYIEAHGTATKIGDAIEIKSLKQAYDSNKKGYCAIGSVKTNIGHLDVAAGVAGLIKTVLSIRNRQIPPSINFNIPNSSINFDESPFYVNTELKKWNPIGNNPLRAAINSFGVGGTNAHIILEEVPKIERNLQARKYNVLNLSAKSVDALNDAERNLSEFLRGNKDISLDDTGFTLAVGRKSFKFRKSIVCKNVEDAIEQLRDNKYKEVSKTKANIVFMFTGQGSQYAGMGKELYDNFDVFKNEIDKCVNIAHNYISADLKEIMFGEPNKMIDETGIAQVVIYIFEYSLARLLNSLGIKQDAMIGHSLGEYVAATLSGVFSIEDGIKIIVARGKLMQSMERGSMLSAMADEDTINSVMDENIQLAAINSSSFYVLTGEDKYIDKCEKKLQSLGCKVIRLNTSHAFHSKMMKEAAEKFNLVLSEVNMNNPKIPYISNLTGDYIKESDLKDGSYWMRHMLNTVQFNKGAQTLLKDKNTIFIEVGPAKTLSSLVLNNSQYKNNCVLIGLNKSNNEKAERYVYEVLASTWENGGQIDWNKYYEKQDVRRISLPTYAFQRKKYTIESTGEMKCFDDLISSSSTPYVEEKADEYLAGLDQAAITIDDSSTIEEKVSTIVKNVFGSDNIKIDDNLVQLGATSLQLIILHNNISSELNIDVPLKRLFENASIKLIVEIIEEMIEKK